MMSPVIARPAFWATAISNDKALNWRLPRRRKRSSQWHDYFRSPEMNIASTQIHPATSWAEAHLHEPIHIDCTTTVMLKILDGKCKMDQQEKGTIALMYDVIKHRPGQLLDDSHHQLIEKARQGMNNEMVLQVYEQRLYAETMITRPVMKAYKAMLRSEGLIK